MAVGISNNYYYHKSVLHWSHNNNPKKEERGALWRPSGTDQQRRSAAYWRERAQRGGKWTDPYFHQHPTSTTQIQLAAARPVIQQTVRHKPTSTAVWRRPRILWSLLHQGTHSIRNSVQIRAPKGSPLPRRLSGMVWKTKHQSLNLFLPKITLDVIKLPWKDAIF